MHILKYWKVDLPVPLNLLGSGEGIGQHRSWSTFRPDAPRRRPQGPEAGQFLVQCPQSDQKFKIQAHSREWIMWLTVKAVSRRMKLVWWRMASRSTMPGKGDDGQDRCCYDNDAQDRKLSREQKCAPLGKNVALAYKITIFHGRCL